MKILLLGDYSSVHVNLFKGLNFLGHDVHLASNGDYNRNLFRNIDLTFKPNKYRFIQGVNRIRAEMNFLNSLENYDVIQIMNPNILSKFHIRNPYEILRKKSKRLVLLSAGVDSKYKEAMRNDLFRYGYTFPKEGFSAKLKRNENFLLNKVDGIISTSYTYMKVYENHPRFVDNIHFPVIMPKSPLFLKNKNSFIFFHGNSLARHYEKGSNFIEEGVFKLNPKWKLDNKFLFKKTMPYKEYIEFLNQVDCVFDQTYGYDPGMNALTCMSKGKIVFGGCEKEYLDTFSTNEPPLINITPDSNYIKFTIESFLEKPELVPELSRRSFEFVKKHHDHIEIAKKYLRCWKEI